MLLEEGDVLVEVHESHVHQVDEVVLEFRVVLLGLHHSHVVDLHELGGVKVCRLANTGVLVFIDERALLFWTIVQRFIDLNVFNENIGVSWCFSDLNGLSWFISHDSIIGLVILNDEVIVGLNGSSFNRLVKIVFVVKLIKHHLRFEHQFILILFGWDDINFGWFACLDLEIDPDLVSEIKTITMDQSEESKELSSFKWGLEIKGDISNITGFD